MNWIAILIVIGLVAGVINIPSWLNAFLLSTSFQNIILILCTVIIGYMIYITYIGPKARAKIKYFIKRRF